MARTFPYPLLLRPVYKDYIWGGDRMRHLPGRSDAPGRCAESWEVADRPDGMSRVLNGELAGTTLHELMESCREELVAAAVRRFPLLVKIIDAQRRLSVQVHPDAHAAKVHGGEPKTECWYVLDAKPGARVFAGLRPGVGPEEFSQALGTDRVEEVLHSVAVSAGQLVYMPAGLVHAIDRGCLLLETQQNSNTTYRIDDWGRVGDDGQPRQLHVAEALNVIDWSLDCAPPAPGLGDTDNAGGEPLVASPFFRLDRIAMDAGRQFPTGGCCHILFTAEGSAAVTAHGVEAALAHMSTCLLPAATEDYSVVPRDGRATVIRIRPGKDADG